MDKVGTAAPHNVHNPEFIPPGASGQPPYTTHYYGVLGPSGTNPVTGQPYLTRPTSTTHGPIGEQGPFQANQRTRFALMTDGTANTLAVGESSFWGPLVGGRTRTWLRGCLDNSESCTSCKTVTNALNSPGVGTFNEIAFGSNHPGGANFCMADGSVQFINRAIPLNTYRMLASRNGGEVAALP
jgi:prepilin-type processing-associated H-X9-DG protein